MNVLRHYHNDIAEHQLFIWYSDYVTEVQVFRSVHDVTSKIKKLLRISLFIHSTGKLDDLT
jgi:hypothetical protein